MYNNFPGHWEFMNKAEAWNVGFRAGVGKSGYALVEIVNKAGGRQKVWKKVGPEPQKEKRSPKRINENLGRGLDTIRNMAHDMIDGKLPEHQLKAGANDLRKLLQKYKHPELEAKMPDGSDPEKMLEFVRSIDKRRGIGRKSRRPGLKLVQVINKKGEEQNLWVPDRHIVKPNKILTHRTGFVKEMRTFPDGHKQNVWVKEKKPGLPEPVRPLQPVGIFEYTPEKAIASVGLTGEIAGTTTGINVSAIIRFEDGTKAFVKIDDVENLDLEYKVSKMFHELFEGKVGFTIPKSHMGEADDFDQIVKDTMNMDEGGALIYNDFVKDALPMGIIDKNTREKIKDKDMIEATIFNYIIGNGDFHANNIMVGNDGKLTVIDTGLAGQYVGRHDMRISGAFDSYLAHKYGVATMFGKGVTNWISEHKQEFNDAFEKFKSVGQDNMLKSFMGFGEFDENTFGELDLRPSEQSLNITGNWTAMEGHINAIEMKKSLVDERNDIIKRMNEQIDEDAQYLEQFEIEEIMDEYREELDVFDKKYGIRHKKESEFEQRINDEKERLGSEEFNRQMKEGKLGHLLHTEEL